MKNLVRFLALLAGINCLYFGWVLAKRLRLPYDAGGRYFEASSGTIIHQQSAIAIAVIFFAGFLLTTVLVVCSRKMQ